ncbi:GNAT family acetyltransferase [Methanobrevibacter sp. YE315]|uniref:GNAT family N-acetyltransferase n=1 Tax=Methanobrevibacter sp. YE315 TaxID=1609968 RepID=UPI000764ECFB|nr:GNAT family N-acetyltransferase [Methanobrevibacter sp. YE315]AMD17971.1 GNAT family acetyltransferase [Methanobrevibacter sp. YE315]
MNVTIKELSKNSEQIKDVQEFLFKMIKKEFGYDYVPEWHQDIIEIDEYYINPERNNFYVAYFEETGEIIATIGIRSYDKDFPEFRHLYSKDTTSSIWRLFVDERCRRCGLASKMFSVAENFANQVGYNDIYLHTHKNLDGALEFWTKMGFVVALDANDELETVHMDKKIQGLEINPSDNTMSYAVKL